MDWLGLAAGDSVLDLGCGGGRNLLGLARRGIVGAGVDVGPYPVQIARESLAPYPMKIMLADMRASVPSGPFDAAVCLYGQITTFPVDEALAILQNTAKALAPGGQLVLELYLGPAMLDALESMESWTVTDRWMTGEYPQLVLDEHYVNWDAAEYVRTSWVIAMEDQGRNLEMVRQGSVIYDAQSLRGLLELAGFELTTLYGDYEGSEFDEDSVNMIAVARRYM